MNKSSSRKLSPNLFRRISIVSLLLVFFSSCIFVLFLHRDVNIFSARTPLLATDSLLWDIYIDDEKVFDDVVLPQTLIIRNGQTIRIETDITPKVDKSFNCYLVKSSFSAIKILLDNEEIFKYPQNRKYPAFLLGCENDFLGFFDRPIHNSHLTIEYSFGSFISSRSIKVHPVRIGSFSEITRLQLPDFLDIYLNFSFYSVMITGLVLLFILVRDIRYKKIISCFSLLSLLLMLLSVLDNPITGLVLENQLASSLLLMVSYVLFPASILLFHRTTGHHKKLKSPLVAIISFIPIMLFIMFCIALTEKEYSSSAIADLTIFSSVFSALAISIIALVSNDSQQSHQAQDFGIAFSAFFILIRGVLLFSKDISSTGHYILSFCTYLPFLFSALNGAVAYMKLERTHMHSREIEEYAYQDLLSNCLNRRSFDDFILKLGNDTEIGILSFDINGMKSINDGFGHTEGDKLLAHFSILNQMDEFRNAKTFRSGGDEFIIFVNSNDEEYLNKLTMKAKKLFSTSAPYGATLSGGYSVKVKGEDIHQAIRRSDKRMYKDKRENRQYSLYDIARGRSYEEK